jgi:FkbM family methyltransferase
MGAVVFGLKNKKMLRNWYVSWKKKKAEEKLKEEEMLLLPQRIQFYSQFITSGDLVFDVGANIGNRIDALLQLNAKVIAVEPQPHCISVLKQKFKNKITIEEVGLGSSAGTGVMHIADVSTISTLSKEFIEKTSSSRFKRNKWESTIEIKLSTLDKLIEKYGVPVFCKIDVEGFEAQVLGGLHHTIPFLSFEYCVPEMQAQLENCLKIIYSLNTTYLFNYSVAETMELAFESWMSYDEFLAVIQTDVFMQTLFGDVYCKLK